MWFDFEQEVHQHRRRHNVLRHDQLCTTTRFSKNGYAYIQA